MSVCARHYEETQSTCSVVCIKQY